MSVVGRCAEFVSIICIRASCGPVVGMALGASQ